MTDETREDAYMNCCIAEGKKVDTNDWRSCRNTDNDKQECEG